jgi:hypothetical protein
MLRFRVLQCWNWRVKSSLSTGSGDLLILVQLKRPTLMTVSIPSLAHQPQYLNSTITSIFMLGYEQRDSSATAKPRFSSLHGLPKLCNRASIKFKTSFESDDHNNCYYRLLPWPQWKVDRTALPAR